MSLRDRGSFTVEKLIVIPWSQSVESYVALGADVEYVRPPQCPDCDCSDLIFWGSRRRFATDGKTSLIVFVRRVRCKGCGKTHTLLPAFLLANQAHLVDLILLALILVFVDGKGSKTIAQELSLARSTVRRWIQRFKASAIHLYRRLLFLKHNLLPRSPSPPAGGYEAAALGLLSQFFGLGAGNWYKFGRWVSLTTGGRLLFHQPKPAT